MKKTMFLFAALIASATLFAEFKKNPDENTLWLEDGVNITTAKQVGKGWLATPDASDPTLMKICQNPDGKGFIMEGYPKAYKTHLYLPKSPDYKYLVMDIEAQEMKKGFNCITIQLEKSGLTWSRTGSIGSEILIFNLTGRKNEVPTAKNESFFFYNYNEKITFNEIKLVKQPDCMIEVLSPAFDTNKKFTIGDTLTFKVTLKEEAEDVSLQLYTSYVQHQITLNGQQKIQLKPVDDAQLVWTAEVKINELKGIDEKNYDKQDHVVIKATLLGGAITKPVWTTIPYGFVK